MDVLESLLMMSLTQAGMMLTNIGQVIGLIVAVAAAIGAARLGWYGTDRVLARRSRTDED
jgi:hypothetical protein